MDVWLDLLFGNPVGLMSVIALLGTLAVVVYLLVLFWVKSGQKNDSAGPE